MPPRDGLQACARLAPSTAAELAQSASKPGPAAVLAQDVPADRNVERVDVYGNAARVVLGGDAFFLAAYPAGWRVRRRRVHGAAWPTYDCSLKGT